MLWLCNWFIHPKPVRYPHLTGTWGTERSAAWLRFWLNFELRQFSSRTYPDNSIGTVGSSVSTKCGQNEGSADSKTKRWSERWASYKKNDCERIIFKIKYSPDSHPSKKQTYAKGFKEPWSNGTSKVLEPFLQCTMYLYGPIRNLRDAFTNGCKSSGRGDIQSDTSCIPLDTRNFISVTRIAYITIRTLQAHFYLCRAVESLVKDSDAHT